eukprot:scaffold7424_cov417-Prasinococcus_capsulatus_cf.AAC.1
MGARRRTSILLATESCPWRSQRGLLGDGGRPAVESALARARFVAMGTAWRAQCTYMPRDRHHL